MFIANPSRGIASRHPSPSGLPSATEARRQGQSGGVGGLAFWGEDRRRLRVGGGLVDGRAGDPGHGPRTVMGGLAGLMAHAFVVPRPLPMEGTFRPFHGWAIPPRRGVDFLGGGGVPDSWTERAEMPMPSASDPSTGGGRLWTGGRPAADNTAKWRRSSSSRSPT